MKIANIECRPANEATCRDLDMVFGSRGEAARCWCQRYKLQPRESFGSIPWSVRAERLRRQTRCGNAGSATTCGLVAYRDGEPVGWCAVEPRSQYPGLLRVYRVPWLGRTEDKNDGSVWAVTCVFTRAGHRRQGVSRALVCAAVDFARLRGARHRRLPDDHAAAAGGCVGRTTRREPPHLCGGGIPRNRPADAAPSGDANRLPVEAEPRTITTRR
ncbi:MAG: GNAT family N-acetyltransferase [Mesorhizobium sp.]